MQAMYQQQQQQQQQQQVQMERPYGFKEKKPQQQSIEIQTDDAITQFEKFQRMGLGNSVMDNVENDGWVPDGDEQGQGGNQGLQDNPNYEKGKDWNFKLQQKQQQQGQDVQQQQQMRPRIKPLPPGMNKEQRAKHNLSVFKKAFAYLLFYFIEIEKRNRIRRQQALEIKGQQGIKCLQAFLEYFKKVLPRVVLAFAENKADMFITDKKKILEDEMNRRIQNVKIQVRKFIIALVETFSAKDIPEEQFEFLGSIMHDFEYLPQNFLFIFELNRVEYTLFGSLKNMTTTRAHMLILTMIVIRVYVFRMILKPWTDFPTVKKKEGLTQNCYVVGSIIYEITMDYIRDRAFKIGQNQAHLNMERKTQPRPYGPLSTDRYQLPEDPAEVRVVRQQEEPVINGLEKREDLKLILDEDKKFVQEMQDYLEEFADSIYDIVHAKYLVKQAGLRKDRLEAKLNILKKHLKRIHPQEQYEATTLAQKQQVSRKLKQRFDNH